MLPKLAQASERRRKKIKCWGVAPSPEESSSADGDSVTPVQLSQLLILLLLGQKDPIWNTWAWLIGFISGAVRCGPSELHTVCGVKRKAPRAELARWCRWQSKLRSLPPPVALPTASRFSRGAKRDAMPPESSRRTGCLYRSQLTAFISSLAFLPYVHSRILTLTSGSEGTPDHGMGEAAPVCITPTDVRAAGPVF